jgi:hypothetical protein
VRWLFSSPTTLHRLPTWRPSRCRATLRVDVLDAGVSGRHLRLRLFERDADHWRGRLLRPRAKRRNNCHSMTGFCEAKHKATIRRQAHRHRWQRLRLRLDATEWLCFVIRPRRSTCAASVIAGQGLFRSGNSAQPKFERPKLGARHTDLNSTLFPRFSNPFIAFSGPFIRWEADGPKAGPYRRGVTILENSQEYSSASRLDTKKLDPTPSQ